MCRETDPDDDWDRPRRRAYDDIRDDYDDQFGHADDRFAYGDPRMKVQAPGTALMAVGWLGVLFSFALAGLGTVLAVEASKRRPAVPDDDLVTGIIIIVGSLLSAAACVVVAIGGSRMRQCRSWGLSLTAAILAIASFVLLGLCSAFVMPFGIWALVVLVQQDVKREFERAGRARRQPARDEWGD
jgi:hypothetical protein